jgi:hypothetical protein
MRSHDEAFGAMMPDWADPRAHSLWLERHSVLEIQKIAETDLQPQDVWFISPLLR